MWSGGLYAGVDARGELLVEVAKVDLSITAARGEGGTQGYTRACARRQSLVSE